MRNKQVIILVHGFNKNQSDMFTLKMHLIKLGYHCLTVNLPTRFGSLNDCTSVMKTQLEKLLSGVGYQKIHFVGHSMGGLIIRNYLANNSLPGLGRCVFISCPSKGSSLADKFCKLFPFITKILKSLNDLRVNALEIPNPKNTTNLEIGVIAGNKSNLLLGVFLKKENDGRVEVDSTKIETMTDFIIKPYGHKEIHYQPDTASLVDDFLLTGKFNSMR
ncbi:MAG: hypothetical protein APF84_11350 [Gracilibacter sp. BRH_c7a]|nr:MAG: hypothetical protein APF84_11350 [Gracilibacter sp. BRH_c7a]